MYSVNSISFHPGYGTFATAGADGTISFWDKDSKQRLKSLAKQSNTIACTAFNRNGSIFAYGASYDWTKVTIACVCVGRCLTFFKRDTSFMQMKDKSTKYYFMQ